MNDVEEMIVRVKSRSINIKAGGVALDGELRVPLNAKGLVIFAHGSGSGRFSPRNQSVSDVLVQNSIATLLLDLLTMEEEAIDDITREFRFNIPMLAQRLADVADWAAGEPVLNELPIGYFGASTGGGAALIAAALRSNMIKAVVSRGGRPDLAADYLPQVKAPTLLIVGELDDVVISLNREAQRRMEAAITDLKIIPGATHLFEETGTLHQVSEAAAEWFLKYMT